MGAIETLDLLKGKVLDAANVEVLRSAYEMQEKNIEQLKTNNEALKDNNQALNEKFTLLKEKYEKLEKDNEEFKRANLALRKKIEAQESIEAEPNEPPPISESAFKILFLYFHANETALWAENIEKVTGLHKIKIKAALAELKQQRLITPYTSNGQWGLTESGAALIASKYFKSWTEFIRKEKKD